MAAQPNPIVLGYIEIIFFFIFKNLLFISSNQNIIQKHQKILIWIKEKKIKIHNFFKRIFETQKETCFNKEIQLNLKWKEIITTQLLYNIKKSHINLFHLYTIKTNSIRKNKLKGKKLNWKYLQ